jgi:hypothetical protein
VRISRSISGVAIAAAVTAGCGESDPQQHVATRDVANQAVSSATPTPPPSGYHDRSGGYRIVDAPLIFILESPHRTRPPDLLVMARLNRRLPKASRGEGFAAHFRIQDGGRDAGLVATGRRAAHCFVGFIDNETAPRTLHAPHDGQQVLFQVEIPGVKPNLAVPAQLRRWSSGEAMHSLSRKLGCANSKTPRITVTIGREQ